jgi:transposase
LATQDGRLVVTVSPRGTSHTCSRCGSWGVRNRSLSKCKKCGYLGNADRNASVNITRRAAIQRPNFGQISARNLSVMAGVLVHAGAR